MGGSLLSFATPSPLERVPNLHWDGIEAVAFGYKMTGVMYHPVRTFKLASMRGRREHVQHTADGGSSLSYRCVRELMFLVGRASVD